MSLNKIIFYKRISFQSRYFNVEGRKITKLEMALFSKRSTHSIDALPKSLNIGVLSSFEGKAPLVLANTSSTGNYESYSHAYKGCMPRASCSVFDRIIEI